MKRARHMMPRSAALGCLMLLCCLALTGCSMFSKAVISGPGTSAPARPAQGEAVPPQVADLPTEAEKALNAGDMARAEQIATRLISSPGLTPPQTARVARVLALSAENNKHYFLSLTALDRWVAVDPAAAGSDEWRRTFVTVLRQLPPHDGQGRARDAAADARRPFPVRSEALLFLAARQWEQGQAAQSLADLRDFYTTAGSDADRAQMEHALFATLGGVDSITLGALAAQMTDENSAAYPHAIIQLENYRRKGMHAAARTEAQRGIADLAKKAALADPGILRLWDAQASFQAAMTPLAGKNLVLALPLANPNGLGAKIAQGAQEARHEFSQGGHSVTLTLIDSQAPDWLDQLDRLPPGATIVGGPLHSDALAAAHARGSTASRTFFAFMPSLNESVGEGRGAWRFFPSAEDQMSALFAATGRLGITEYGILLPDNDPWATQMADMFTTQAQARGGRVVKRAEYPKGAPERWNKFMASYLGTNNKATSKPHTPHRALFLPDSWRNMELIVPNLFYFLETRQLLLGTPLWEQGLSAARNIPEHYYKLAVFPGAWNKAEPSPGGERLYAAYARAGREEPDFWAGLGYDFVRFAATLDVREGWTPGEVNTLLAGNSGMQWSIAPITWSPTGKASQNLFLFSPVKDGFAPTNMTTVEEAFTKAWK